MLWFVKSLVYQFYKNMFVETNLSPPQMLLLHRLMNKKLNSLKVFNESYVIVLFMAISLCSVLL